MTSPISTVNWTQPNYEAMPETDGHGTTCGIDAILSYLHLAKDFPLTIAQVDSMYNELHALGLIDVPGGPGMSMQAIKSALNHYGIQEVKFVDYNASLNPAAFRDDLINAGINHQCVVAETANAQALPGNQQGVFYHFISFWGISSNLGYYCANGDLVSDFNPWTTSPTTPVWYGIGALNAARIVGYIILPAVQEKPDVIILEHKDTADPNHITGCYDENDTSKHFGEGLANTVNTAGLLQQDITLGETPVSIDTVISNDGVIALGVVSNRYILAWSKLTNHNVIADLAEVAIAVEQLVKDTSTPKPTIENDSAVAAALAVVAQDAATLASNAAELQKDINSLEIAQTADR